MRSHVLLAIAFGAILCWVLTGLFIVRADQKAVISRLGAYARTEGPGLHFHLPVPIEREEVVSASNPNRLDLGTAHGPDAPGENLMLTGDGAIVDLSFAVQWRVSDAAAYLFRARDPDEAIRSAARSAMSEVVGRSALDTLLTTSRAGVQDQTRDLMQRVLDGYHTGVIIDAVQIRNAGPPAELIGAYQDIARARQEAQTSINDANTYRNKVTGEAQGDAARIVQGAQGYREQVVREAQGQVAAFNQVYAEYRRAPAVTRERLYLEMMQEVLTRSHKVIVDAKGVTAPIVLPPEAFRSPTTAPTPPSGAAQ